MVFAVACMRCSPVISKIECNMLNNAIYSIKSTKNIVCGMLQGSIIGPLLFIVYVNDLYISLDKSYCLLFDDDTVFFK